VSDPADALLLEGRAVIVRRLQALPIEAVVRGYLIGSGWKDYVRPGGSAASSCRRDELGGTAAGSRSSRLRPRPPPAA
jgi:hypothetical protein